MEIDCHSIVIEYLIHNCYKNTAKAFLRDSNKLESCTSRLNKPIKKLAEPMEVDDDEQWVLLDARKALIQAIERGDIPEAFDLINKHFPSLAAQDGANDQHTAQLIMFKLHCQQFIEIIRLNSTDGLGAIRYAQKHLNPTTSVLKEKVKEVTSLIAYTNPEESHAKHLLSQERREQLAAEVNHVILAQCHLPVQTSIERMSRQYSIVDEELSKLNDQEFAHREKVAM
ncbi:hypothetical protein K501DRAFT_319858 [Backusella circina FSU 941]|nr:hypothetical protein K501DRAFT_319858 [Backusella circina FSU 941]